MTEHDEQVALFAWARRMIPGHPELALMFAIPNGAKLPWTKNEQGKRYSREAQVLKAEGLTPGVPDICLAVPRWGYHALWIEMKYGDNTLTPEQQAFLAALEKQGYFAAVRRSAEEAIGLIEWYLDFK